MLHTFNGHCYTKYEKYMKMWLQSCFFMYFSFRVVGSIESMQHGYLLDEELNFHPTSTPTRNLSKTLGR